MQMTSVRDTKRRTYTSHTNDGRREKKDRECTMHGQERCMDTVCVGKTQMDKKRHIWWNEAREKGKTHMEKKDTRKYKNRTMKRKDTHGQR